MYRIDGSPDLKEEVLEHWRGYRGSAPVRIGNGAAEQLQLDIYGEAIDAMYAAVHAGLPLPFEGWRGVRGGLGWVGGHRGQPGGGVLETPRGRAPLPLRRPVGGG